MPKKGKAGRGRMCADTDRQNSEDLAAPDDPGIFRYANPFNEESPSENGDETGSSSLLAGPDPNSSVEDQTISANKAEMTEDELADLMYAFQAADVDGGGSIDAEEFEMMLTVMGCKISMDQVLDVIEEAKAGFAAWKRIADREHIEKCRRIWNEYDKDKDNMLNLSEVNSVIKKLQTMGYSPALLTSTDMSQYTNGEMDFDQFSAWFLKQEGLPNDMYMSSLGGSPRAAALRIGAKKKQGLARKGLAKALIPFQIGRKVAMGPALLLEKSARMMNFTNKADTDPDNKQFDADKFAEQMMNDKDQLIFAEYVFMMRAGALKAYLPGDWQTLADDMRKLREAFDTADVDGNNELELEELEMCIRSMHPTANIEHADVVRVWAVLNPEDKPWIPYGDFVKGMIKTKKDPELSELIPLDIPNRFMLLSLLIDTPINEGQENLLTNKLGRAEKAGIGILKKMERPAMNRAEIKEKLEMACSGRLHHLSDAQRKKLSSIHIGCVVQAFFIATIFTGIPGLFENFLVYTFKTDGVYDAYFTCNEIFGDPLTANWKKNETWLLNVLGIVLGIILEIGLLIFTALRSAVKVSTAVDLRLVPLNQDRAKVAGMIIRSVFELPDPNEDDSLGLESHGYNQRSKVWDVMAIVFIKSKVLITGFFFKQITQKVVLYDTATWIMPYTGTMAACALWDSLLCHAIMRRVELRAIGVTTAVEVFNEIFDKYCPAYEAKPDAMSQICRIQILRAIGVSIVRSGEMFPTIELLLCHAINYFNMKKSSAVRTGGVIDNEDDFLSDMRRISQDERRAVLSVHMLCYVLDGSISSNELGMWKLMLDRVEGLYQKEKGGDMPASFVTFDSGTPKRVCAEFRQQKPVTVELLAACWDPTATEKFLGESENEFAFQVSEIMYTTVGLLTKQV